MAISAALVRIGATLFPFIVAEIVILAIVWPLVKDAIADTTDKPEEQ